MFRTPNLKATLKAISLRLEETKNETRRIADCKFVLVPFDCEPAGELGKEVARHCFVCHPAPEHINAPCEPREEIADVTFALTIPLQRFSVRLAPDMPKATATIEPATIRKVRVTRPDPEKKLLECSFVVSFEIDTASLMPVVHELGESVYLTFESLQRELPLEAALAVDRLASAVRKAGIDSMTISCGGKSVTVDKPAAERIHKRAQRMQREARA